MVENAERTTKEDSHQCEVVIGQPRPRHPCRGLKFGEDETDKKERRIRQLTPSESHNAVGGGQNYQNALSSYIKGIFYGRNT